MLRVGLTGGLATGKSFVGQTLRSLGCHVLQADQLGHQALEPGSPAFQPVLALFGDSILTADGHINRRQLGAQVFGDPHRLAQLNALVHPVVIDAEERWMQSVAAAEPDAIALVEAAILIETGSHLRFDRLILTVCREDQQVERAMKRDGLTEPEIRQRLQRQMPLQQKRQYVHFLIDTSRDKDNTLEQVHDLYAHLRSIRV